jgi:hypothetical protein
MEINRINSNFIPTTSTSKKKAVSTTESKVGDKIEISNEAKILQQQNVSSKDLSGIKENIENKFYDSDEVIDKVADNIIKEVSNSKE